MQPVNTTTISVDNVARPFKRLRGFVFAQLMLERRMELNAGQGTSIAHALGVSSSGTKEQVAERIVKWLTSVPIKGRRMPWGK